MVLHRAI